MIFQQPQSSLNPVTKVGNQIAEVLQLHRHMSKKKGWEQAIELLQLVGIPDAERRANAYPHELSGGMAQRVMIAMALACEPELLIADEPTTGLDVTIQAQILDLMGKLRTQMSTSVILITHDLGVIAEQADRVAVMYAGRIVEEAEVNQLFARPLHPYTQGLIGSLPVLGDVRQKLETIPGTVPNLVDLPPGCKFASRCQACLEHDLAVCTQIEPELALAAKEHTVRCWLYHDSEMHVAPLASALQEGPTAKAQKHRVSLELAAYETDNDASVRETAELVRVEHLVKHFPVRGGLLQRHQGVIQAVDDVSFTIQQGETLGLVGESGCGKTTVGRAVLRLTTATNGSVMFGGEDVFKAEERKLKALRREMQIVFQDPYSSLDPRMQVGESIAEGLLIHGLHSAKERHEIVVEMLRQVGLEEYHARRYPHEFSGGQRQRIGIARALAVQPKFIVCDEPVSALDVSIQSQILNLLHDIQHRFNIAYLFIAHDLSVIEHISDRVAVMYLGKIVELADRNDLFRNPQHPYTQALMSAIPMPDPTRKGQRIILQGDVPSPLNPPSGCRFHTRCPVAMEHCKQEEPVFKEVAPKHWAACWLLE
jgi:peptide/nickel transport system ATP-binding protein